MATFVLVHGAFRGGWYFEPLADRLRRAGHEVWAPSLAGMGEHAHHAEILASAGPLSRDVWVRDLTSLVATHQLTDVVLVGHSLGGVIAAEAADRLGPDMIGALVYLDAPVLRPGQSPADLYPTPPPGGAGRPSPDPASWSSPLPVNRVEITDDATATWMAARLTPTPVGPGIGALQIGDVATWSSIPCHIAFCEQTPDHYPAKLSRKELDAAGIAYEVLDAGHDAPVSAPHLVAGWLCAIAGTVVTKRSS